MEFLISLVKGSRIEEIINFELIVSIEPENENECENIEELEENEKSLGQLEIFLVKLKKMLNKKRIKYLHTIFLNCQVMFCAYVEFPL
jgi:cell shape-determining protein MreC